MSAVWLRKLETFSALTAQDRRALAEASADVRSSPAQHTILHEGDFPENAHLVVEGFACRSKSLRNGQRQTSATNAPSSRFQWTTTSPPWARAASR